MFIEGLEVGTSFLAWTFLLCTTFFWLFVFDNNKPKKLLMSVLLFLVLILITAVSNIGAGAFISLWSDKEPSTYSILASIMALVGGIWSVTLLKQKHEQHFNTILATSMILCLGLSTLTGTVTGAKHIDKLLEYQKTKNPDLLSIVTIPGDTEYSNKKYAKHGIIGNIMYVSDLEELKKEYGIIPSIERINLTKVKSVIFEKDREISRKLSNKNQKISN